MRKLALLSIALVVLLVSPHGADGQKTGLQSEDLHRLRSVGAAQLSPDGNKILYTVVSRVGDRGTSSKIMVWDIASGTSSPLLAGDVRGSSPLWSPDGQWIAYRGREGERSGLMVVRADGSGAKFLAPMEGTNHPLPSSGKSITWSPDGKSIAFVHALPGPETEDATGDPVVITRYLYKPTAREGLTRFNDNKRIHVFVIGVDGTGLRQLTKGDYYEHSVDWSPAGDEILFISNREPDPDRFFNYDIFAVKVADGTVRRITRTETAEYQPFWSPDGKTIAYLGTTRGLTSSETTMEDTHVWLVDADGSNRRELGATVDNRQRSHGWTPDGSAVLCTVQERGHLRLYRLPVSGAEPEVIVREMGGRGTSWTMASGDLLAYSTASQKDMAQLFLKKGSSAPEQLTDLNADLLAGREIAKVESVVLKSFDGLEVEAFLTLPLGITETSKHPMIATIKGGPHGQQGPYFDYRAQVYAAHGWATLMVNYRGSTGYGQAFADAIFGDQDGGEAKDVLYAVNAAARRYGWIDPERLGIQGGSYGGQLTMWIITQTDRFKAAIPMYGICNLLSFNYMAYYHDYLAVEFGAFPHQDNLMDVLWERSALKHVANVKTPAMLVHGENDNDVPIAESEQFYIALKDVGVETIMVRYPREGHGVREIAHQIDLIERSIAWYEKHF
jgi:dipeptidyl aminopeptidase/acylaminoacyl peptidase